MNKLPTPANWTPAGWLGFGAICGFASASWMFVGEFQAHGNLFRSDWAPLYVIIFAVAGVVASIPGAAIGLGFSALPYKMPFALKVILVAVLAQLPLYIFFAILEYLG